MSRITLFIFFISISQVLYSQTHDDIRRIEFNSGTRTYREQIILTADSVVCIQEDFQVDKKPRLTARKATEREWSGLIASLQDVRMTEIETLESPTMKRTFDGASHGSIIITTKDNSTFTHGFDDEDPHKKLKPLMSQIRKFRKK